MLVQLAGGELDGRLFGRRLLLRRTGEENLFGHGHPLAVQRIALELAVSGIDQRTQLDDVARTLGDHLRDLTEGILALVREKVGP